MTNYFAQQMELDANTLSKTIWPGDVCVVTCDAINFVRVIIFFLFDFLKFWDSFYIPNTMPGKANIHLLNYT